MFKTALVFSQSKPFHGHVVMSEVRMSIVMTSSRKTLRNLQVIWLIKNEIKNRLVP